MVEKNYNYDLTMYENLVFKIYQTVDNFQTSQKGVYSSELNKKILNDLNFEIVNDFYNRNVLISYVVKSDTDIQEIENCLLKIGVDKKFINKSNPKKKQYLTVWL